jgi:hypothetical protein
VIGMPPKINGRAGGAIDGDLPAAGVGTVVRACARDDVERWIVEIEIQSGHFVLPLPNELKFNRSPYIEGFGLGSFRLFNKREGSGFLVGAALSRTLSMSRKALGNARKRSCELRLRVARILDENPSNFLKDCIFTRHRTA